MFSVLEEEDQSAYFTLCFCLSALEKECICSIVLYDLFVSLWKYLKLLFFCFFLLSWFIRHARWKDEARFTVFLRNKEV